MSDEKQDKAMRLYLPDMIGGINLKTIDAVVAAGAQRVAVSQAVAQADDPRAAAAGLLGALTAG